MKNKNKSKIFENIALVSHIGISMVVPILGGVLLGNFLDNKFGTSIVFLIVFLVLGVVVSFMNLFKIATRDTDKRK